MQITVPEYVSSVTYHANTPKSVSYIVNTKTHFLFLLNDISSDLWNTIINSKSNNEIEKFVKNT